MKKVVKTVIWLMILVGIGYGGYKIYLSYSTPTSRTVLKTETVTRTNIIRSISATGTVEPEELIDVGAQVNGKIMKFGTDLDGKPVDYGSRVKKGEVIALIDDIVYDATYKEAQAAKQQALASIATAQATIQDAQAAEMLAQNNWKRAQTLYKEKSMTESNYDIYNSGYQSALAQTAKAKASLQEANAQLQVAEAALVKAKRNLEYCTITSPVDGIIIDRRVSVGQTVVSNQTASNIFLVAKNFDKMQVWVSVNEADIGVIKKGMQVQFFCDAFPGVEFRGEVYRLRLNATLSSNVVTYIVEVNTNNENGKLIPYLTANVKFIKDERRNVLAVPSTLLSYNPSPEMFAAPPSRNPEEGEILVFKPAPNNKIIPIVVKMGLNNGSMAELISDELQEGDKLVSGVKQVAIKEGLEEDSTTKNPFLPSFPKRGGRSNKKGGRPAK